MCLKELGVELPLMLRSHPMVHAYLTLHGVRMLHLVLKIALPLGISYYTFQITGYLIDVYNGTSDACRKPLQFVTYVMHFPKMLAGPVEPARDLLPRIEKARVFDPAMASDAFRQILWGVFAKMVIADNCAAMIDPVFAHSGSAAGSTLFAGAILYFLQLYGDFSGYSNMAIGLSKLLGIPLMVNFRAPLFVTDIGEFWRKWHISLTSWMMEYVFTPLSFLLRSKGKAGLALSILATFLAVGIWHGANWAFIAFGLLQGIYFLPMVFKGSLLRAAPKGATRSAGFRRAVAMAGMFLLMSLTFVLVRAPDLHAAWKYWTGILSPSLFSFPQYKPNFIPVLLVFFLLIEYRGRDRDHALAVGPAPATHLERLSLYAALLAGILVFGYYGATGFIYFQF